MLPRLKLEVALSSTTFPPAPPVLYVLMSATLKAPGDISVTPPAAPLPELDVHTRFKELLLPKLKFNVDVALADVPNTSILEPAVNVTVGCGINVPEC